MDSPAQVLGGWRAGRVESAGHVCVVARELLVYGEGLPSEARAIAILGVSEMVTELTRPGSALRGWTSVTVLQNDVVNLMSRMLDSPGLDFRLRVRVGDLLAGLGDVRLARLDSTPDNGCK